MSNEGNTTENKETAAKGLKNETTAFDDALAGWQKATRERDTLIAGLFEIKSQLYRGGHYSPNSELIKSINALLTNAIT